MRRIAALLTLFLLLGIVMSAEAALKPEYLPGRLLVRFTQDVGLRMDGKSVTSTDPEINRLLDRFGAYSFKGTFEPYIVQDPEYREVTKHDITLAFPEVTDMELVAHEFSATSVVEEAIPDWLMYLDSCPTNDPQIAAQWWLNNTQAKDAWCYVTGDESVIVAAIDSGLDWNHPDYIDNIWVNQGEDPGGDVHTYDNLSMELILTNGSNDGVDNDGNGLVDDFIGYDFVSNAWNPDPNDDHSNPDNNPMDYGGHGTGVSGAMAQVGNNELMAVGMAYNVQMMAMKSGYTDNDGLGRISTGAALQCLAYVVDNGAQVINMSYGGSPFSSQENSAMANAWNNGALLFGAAGNDGVSSLHYPSGYANVIAVGATTQSDNRASFSNWGDWVNISSPGENCLTGWYDDGSDTWSGTSVASPIAAGIGALVIQSFPDSSNLFWRQVIESTTDAIETDHPLGTGRVNAYKAVTQYKFPSLSIDSVAVISEGENGHPDPGEDFQVYVALSNAEGWLDASTVTITASFDMPELDPTFNGVVIGSIENGGSGDNADNLINVSVPDDAPDGAYAQMFLTITADPNDYVIETQKRILIGKPDVLVIDNDGGADYEKYIAADLDSLDEVFFSYDVSRIGAEPTTAVLTEAPNVFWMTGDLTNPLSATSMANITSAIDQGTNIFIFGQTLDDQLTGDDFYTNVLHAAHSTGDIVFQGLMAVDGAGGPVVDGERLVMSGATGPNNSTNPDVIDPLDGAVASYRYINASGDGPIGGLYYEGENHKLVYFSFAFEAVGGINGTTPRSAVIGHILSWFRGETDVPETPVAGEAVPERFAIESAYPNPFNPSTTLRVSVPAATHVRLAVYDVLGREVATLVDGAMAPGVHAVSWNALGNANGIYFAVLEAAGTRQVTKLAFVK